MYDFQSLIIEKNLNFSVRLLDNLDVKNEINFLCGSNNPMVPFLCS